VDHANQCSEAERTVSYSDFFGLYALSLVGAIWIGLILMEVNVSKVWRPVRSFLRCNYAYIALIVSLPLMVQFISLAKVHSSDPGDVSESLSNAHLLYDLGGGLIPSLQNHLDSDLLESSLGFVYMWVFAFFTYFLPILLIARGDRRNFVIFALAVAINYAVLIPFYITFPVAVSSNLLGTGVEPVLYSSSVWGRMATSVDSLTNCFPSGHVSLSFTAFFVFALAGQGYRRLSYVLLATALSLGLAVLYLGIHYPADVVSGFVLAFYATAMARSESVRASLGKAFRALLSRLTAGKA
jgi:membrane-associated phospholipid phosphatase